MRDKANFFAGSRGKRLGERLPGLTALRAKSINSLARSLALARRGHGALSNSRYAFRTQRADVPYGTFTGVPGNRRRVAKMNN